MGDKYQVQIIDQTDELNGFVGDIVEIRSGGWMLIYFDEVCASRSYHLYQIKYLGGQNECE